jgi:hypothetical protein
MRIELREGFGTNGAGAAGTEEGADSVAEGAELMIVKEE